MVRVPFLALVLPHALGEAEGKGGGRDRGRKRKKKRKEKKREITCFFTSTFLLKSVCS